MSYTPKNNFNLQLGRTGIGKRGFKKKLWKVVTGTCEDSQYFFRWVPKYIYLQRDVNRSISIVGGVGDFNWSVVGAGFSIMDAVTAGRNNFVSTDGSVNIGDSAIVTVIDSCGNSVEGNLKVCSEQPGV